MKKMMFGAALIAAAMVPQAKADTLLGLYVGGDYWAAQTSGALGTSSDMQSFNFEDKEYGSYYAALEHPIPLVPNVKLKYNQLELNASTELAPNQAFLFDKVTFQNGGKLAGDSDLSHIDYVLYYEIFDNDLVSIDLGVSAKQFDGYITVSGTGRLTDNTSSDYELFTETVDFNGFIPMAYGAVQFGLPFTGLSAFAEGQLLAVGDSKIRDYQVGVAWEFIDNMAVDVAIKAGYRAMLLELDDVDDIYTDIEVDGVFAGLQVHF